MMQSPNTIKSNVPKSAIFYFLCVGFLTVGITALYAMTIDWSVSNISVASLQILIIGYLLWGVSDVITQLLFSLIFKLWNSHINFRQTDMSNGIASKNRTLLAYMLRSNHTTECYEPFENMYQSYMDNLDINGNITAVLVSASTSLSIVEHEMDLRDKYRNIIRRTLFSESEIYKDYYLYKNNLIKHYPREYFWSHIFHSWKKQGYNTEQLDASINDIIEHVVSGYKYIHRTSTTLKKTGQYQDLMLISSRGIDRPFTYLEEKYDKIGRLSNIPIFGFGSNVQNDCNLLKHDFNHRVKKLESRGYQDIIELKSAGLTYTTSKNAYYRYTIILDSDNRMPQGSARSLIEIAAANPGRGFLQPGLLVSNMDTWHALREVLSHKTVSKLPQALFQSLGRFGNYGKGLVNNDIYIKEFIGSPRSPKETLPINILSHDTIEALYLNPAYVPNVFFYEGATSNLFSRHTQLTRWACGDLMNTLLLFPKSAGRAFIFLKPLFSKSEVDLSFNYELPTVPLTARYIAHLSSRALFRAPLFLLWIFIETFGQTILIHTNPLLMQIHFYLIIFGLVILPKMYIPFLNLISSIKYYFLFNYSKATTEIKFALRNFIIALIEILTAPFVYMPDILNSPIRLSTSIYSLILGRSLWKAQAEVERETWRISITSSFRKTWFYPAIAMGITIAILLHEVSASILLIAMLITWYVFPITVWLSAKPLSVKQRNNAILLWLLEDFNLDRLYHRGDLVSHHANNKFDHAVAEERISYIRTPG